MTLNLLFLNETLISFGTVWNFYSAKFLYIFFVWFEIWIAFFNFFVFVVTRNLKELFTTTSTEKKTCIIYRKLVRLSLLRI